MVKEAPGVWEMGRWGNGEIGRLGDWGMGSVGDGEIGGWGVWEKLNKKYISSPLPCRTTQNSNFFSFSDRKAGNFFDLKRYLP